MRGMQVWEGVARRWPLSLCLSVTDNRGSRRIYVGRSLAGVSQGAPPRHVDCKALQRGAWAVSSHPRGLVPARHRGLESACESATRAIYDCGVMVRYLLAEAN